MLTDPQIITINSIAKSMPRVAIGGLGSKTGTIYQTSDELVKLTINHTKSNTRVRSVSRVDQRAIVVDPLSSVSDYDSLGIYLVIDRPEYGFSVAQIDYLVTGYKTWLSSAILAQLLGGES